ncbi:MAG: hypothetical protein R3C69_16965 [Geminicoccaceae bacterium]
MKSRSGNVVNRASMAFGLTLCAPVANLKALKSATENSSGQYRRAGVPPGTVIAEAAIDLLDKLAAELGHASAAE